MYPGGKNQAGVYQRIINLMPPHEVYIEPFLGSGAVMVHKRAALVNIGIDLDMAALDQARARNPAFHDGGRRFRFLQADGIQFLADHEFTGHTLVYCDPPYLMSTRSSRRQIYRHEMSEQDHRRLLSVLNAIAENCMILLSGYWSELYTTQLHWLRWQSSTFQVMLRGRTLATEWLWANYPAPVALHDYKFLGANFRERERISRKKARWTARLRKLPALERQALLAAIAENDLNDLVGSASTPGQSLPRSANRERDFSERKKQ